MSVMLLHLQCSVDIYSVYGCYFFFFKQKTAYEMRMSDWSSDVCSSDLASSSARSPMAAISSCSTDSFDSSSRTETSLSSVGFDPSSGSTAGTCASYSRSRRTIRQSSSSETESSICASLLPPINNRG